MKREPAKPPSAATGAAAPAAASDGSERDTRVDPLEVIEDAERTLPNVAPPFSLSLPSPRVPPLKPPPIDPSSVTVPHAGPDLFGGTGSSLSEASRFESPRSEALRLETPRSEAPRSETPGTTDSFRPRAPRVQRGWPFVPLAPLLVVVVGLGVALGIGLVGLDQLSRAGDEHAGIRADLIAATVAARLGALPAERRFDATQLAARRSGAELLVVAADGEIIHDRTLGAPDQSSLRKMIATKSGVAEMRMGRARYAVRAIGPPSDPLAPRLVVLVPEPRVVASSSALATALLALAVLLLGVAASVAYAVSRDVIREVEYVTRRVRTMGHVRSEPTGELIPARTMDEVGILTATFNKLVGRFGIASSRYREDLVRATAADRERAAFLAAVSHELRSPLNAILGFADILMEEVDGPLSPSAREEVEQIRGSGTHLAGLINDILEFSALESGQLRLSRSRVDVLSLANEVMKESRGLVGDRPLAVRVEGESVVARVDGRRVRQILGNLVNNAIKFTRQGSVVVSVRRRGPSVAIVVTDTGPGISAEERALIFEEYKQAESERTRRRGTGLGLAIARRLVMLHHGSISVESELGRGSSFEVLLPVGNVDAPPSQKQSGPLRRPGEGRSRGGAT